MGEKLGVVSNIWARRLAAGDRFEELAVRFAKEGFPDIEIRDGDYLQASEFGLFLRDIVKMSEQYPAAAWKAVCEALSSGQNPAEAILPIDRPLFDRIRRFKEITSEATFTYAIQHPWLGGPDDPDAHDRRIVAAKKLALLFSSRHARMRLVDLSSADPIDMTAAAVNLNRYRSLAGELPVIHAVENARQSATLTLKIAAEAGFLIAYDEANLFFPGDRVLEPPELFRESLDPRSLASVHLKQKSGAEVLPHLCAGRVDLHGILKWMRKLSYAGDLLLETAASENPLRDARTSRDYLLALG